jgi:hypothetical protein
MGFPQLTRRRRQRHIVLLAHFHSQGPFSFSFSILLVTLFGDYVTADNVVPLRAARR